MMPRGAANRYVFSSSPLFRNYSRVDIFDHHDLRCMREKSGVLLHALPVSPERVRT
jgi:hypothetical protein